MSGWPILPVSDGQVSRTSALARVAWLDPPRQPTLLIIGDSYAGTDRTVSTNEDAESFVKQFEALARREGDALIYIGDRWVAPYDPSSSVDGWRASRPGYTIAEVDTGREGEGTTGYAGIVATTGQPDIVVIAPLGTNSFAIRTGAQCASDYSSLLDNITSTSPSAWVVCITPKPSTTASPNDVARAALTASMLSSTGCVRVSSATGAARSSRVSVVDPLLEAKADGAKGDSPAYTHLSHGGKWKVARALWDHIRANVLGPITGPKWPRPRGQHPAGASLSLDGGASTRVPFAAGVFDPGAGNFMLCMQVWHTSLDAGKQLFCYGNSIAANGLTILSGTAGICDVYQGTKHVMSAVPHCFVTGRGQSLVVAYDATADVTTLWIDGIFRFSLEGTGALSGYAMPVNDTAFIGAINGSSAITGYVKHLALCKGALVPGWNDGTGTPGPALRRAVEAYDRDIEIPRGCVEYLKLDDAGTPSIAWVGTNSSAWSVATSSAAGTPAWPHDETSPSDPDGAYAR